MDLNENNHRQENFFTHSLYKVKEGGTAAFLAVRKQFVEALLQTSVSGLIKGTLIQSEADPRIFYSFGAWESPEPLTICRPTKR